MLREPDWELDGRLGEVGLERPEEPADGCDGADDWLAERWERELEELEELDELDEDGELAELDELGDGMLGVWGWGRGELVLQALRSERLRAQVAITVTALRVLM